jgi:hypothetical protein
MMRCGKFIVALIVSSFLAACATRPVSPPPPPEPAAVPDKATVTKPSTPVSRQTKPVESAPEPPVARPTPKPVSRPVEKTPTVSIPQLVTAGKLESASAQSLVFVSNQPMPAEDQGLFEDAIILNRVRAGLKAASLPEFAGAARMASGALTLEVPETSQEGSVADAVNTALKAEGVRKVVVNFVATPDGAGE